ncbi:RAG1-ACTIVATING PROTEIN 1 [Salix viminalis]|uniref:RAG1-ACTIVATING PROTEIN 1 n=1 Tax=Salix viminalis TaxID=40686 RepID=A0A9Q0ZK76_SALVM|nr:RAG1-ACTIVATING PROTEIN 1 [Salix viminalis]
MLCCLLFGVGSDGFVGGRCFCDTGLVVDAGELLMSPAVLISWLPLAYIEASNTRRLYFSMANTAFIVGVLGNIISGLVYLSPLKTFWRIVKKRSTENFSSIPYIITLMNAILWIYYGITKPDSFLIATINGFGAAAQIVYILIFLVFVSPRMRARTALLVGLLDVGLAAAAILFTHFMLQGRCKNRCSWLHL